MKQKNLPCRRIYRQIRALERVLAPSKLETTRPPHIADIRFRVGGNDRSLERAELVGTLAQLVDKVAAARAAGTNRYGHYDAEQRPIRGHANLNADGSITFHYARPIPYMDGIADGPAGPFDAYRGVTPTILPASRAWPPREGR